MLNDKTGTEDNKSMECSGMKKVSEEVVWRKARKKGKMPSIAERPGGSIAQEDPAGTKVLGGRRTRHLSR